MLTGHACAEGRKQYCYSHYGNPTVAMHVLQVRRRLSVKTLWIVPTIPPPIHLDALPCRIRSKCTTKSSNLSQISVSRENMEPCIQGETRMHSTGTRPHLHPILRFRKRISFVCSHCVPPSVTVLAYMKANLREVRVFVIVSEAWSDGQSRATHTQCLRRNVRLDTMSLLRSAGTVDASANSPTEGSSAVDQQSTCSEPLVGCSTVDYSTDNPPQSFKEILQRLVLVGKRFHKTAHLEALQGLLEARVAAHRLGIAIVLLVPHSAVRAHVLQPGKPGLSVLVNTLADLAPQNQTRAGEQTCQQPALTTIAP